VKARLRLLGALAAPLPVLALATGPSFAGAAAPRAALHGEVLSAIGQSTRVGDLSPNAGVSVAVTLSPRDPAALDRFIAAVSDRRSPEYGHYLTPDQFSSRFGPTSATVDQVTAYLASQGLKVTNVAKGNLVDWIIGFDWHHQFYDFQGDRDANGTIHNLAADVDIIRFRTTLKFK